MARWVFSSDDESEANSKISMRQLDCPHIAYDVVAGSLLSCFVNDGTTSLYRKRNT